MFDLAVQNDVCAEFYTRRLFSHSSAEEGKFFSVLTLALFGTDLSTAWETVPIEKLWEGFCSL